MKIPVTCAGCHRQYEVDDRFAGKTVKCAYCGKPMSIPAAEPAPPLPPPAFDEYQLGDPHELAPSTFRAAPARAAARTQGRRRGRARRNPGNARRRKAAPRALETPFSLPVILISLAAIAVVLALLAVFVPGARKAVGVALALPGLLLAFTAMRPGSTSRSLKTTFMDGCTCFSRSMRPITS